jgi:hypothetical protein
VLSWHAQGVQLDEAYSLSALQLALEELPVAWAEQARRDPKGMFMKVSSHHSLGQEGGAVDCK